MFKKNDRVKLVCPIDKLQKIGEIFKISNIIGYIIVIVSEETGERGTISDIGIRKYFEKVEEPADDKPLKGVSYEKIEKLMAEANINVTTFFGKTTVVAAQFPNGFVITESSSYADPITYDEEEGKQICLKRIKERLWEMEGYFLQEQEYQWNQTEKSVNATAIKSAPATPKNEVTSEIARIAHKDLMATFKKEYERDKNFNFEEVYFKRIEEMSKEFNVEHEKLAEKIAEISARNIYEEFMNKFFCIALY